MRVVELPIFANLRSLMIPKVVPHVHFHVIPKPEESNDSGLVIGWPTQEFSKEELEKIHKEIKGKL